MNYKEIKRIENAIYREKNREMLNRKQRERYAGNSEYREYQRIYQREYWKMYERASRAKSA